MTNTPITVDRIARSLNNSIKRDPNPNALAKGAILPVGGTAILVDVADPTGANGQRSFIIEIREV